MSDVKTNTVIDYTNAKIVVEDRTNTETGEVFKDRVSIILQDGQKLKTINKKVEVVEAMKAGKESFFSRIIKEKGEYGTYYRLDNAQITEELTFA